MISDHWGEAEAVLRDACHGRRELDQHAYRGRVLLTQGEPIARDIERFDWPADVRPVLSKLVRWQCRYERRAHMTA